MLHSLDSVARSKGITRADCLRAAAEAWIQANTDVLALVEPIGTDPVPFNRKAALHIGAGVNGSSGSGGPVRRSGDPEHDPKTGWLTE